MSHSTERAVRMRPWFAVALLGPLLGALGGANAGQLYQWKDAQGVTHYADSPPAGRAYQHRTIRDRGNAVATEAKPTESAACMTARINLEHLQSTAVVGFDADGDGKPDAPFDAAQRAAQTQLAAAAVQAHCTATAPQG